MQTYTILCEPLDSYTAAKSSNPVLIKKTSQHEVRNQCLYVAQIWGDTFFQGGVLTTVGILGTFLSGFTIYCLIFHVKLPYSQVMINNPRSRVDTAIYTGHRPHSFESNFLKKDAAINVLA